MNAVIDGTLSDLEIEWDDNAAVCVVMASGGYPVSYEKGHLISGIEYAESMDNVTVFHAGTKLTDDGFTNAGGRVLGVTATDTNLDEAIKRAYKAVEKITWKDEFHRNDIGVK